MGLPEPAGCGDGAPAAPAGHWHGSAPPGGTLALEVTARCNRACAYCYNAWKADPGYPRVELDAACLVSLVRGVLAAGGIRRLQISGGEPLLRADLFEIIAGLQGSGARISLVTDGSGIGEAEAAQLARLKVAPVQPTLLAAERSLHDALKGAACFDDTVAAIARLRRAGVPVSVAFVCTRQNWDRLHEVVELCFALDVKTIAFSRCCAAGAASLRPSELLPTREMVLAGLEVAEWANARLGMNVRVAISLPPCAVEARRFPHLALGRCAVTSEQPGYTIDPAGNLRVCSISPTVLGSLLDEPWAALMARARLGYLRELAEVPAACRVCPLLIRCGGGCRETARACNGGRPGAADPLAAL